MSQQIKFIAEVAGVWQNDRGEIQIYDYGCGCCADGGTVSKEQALLMIREQFTALHKLYTQIEELP